MDANAYPLLRVFGWNRQLFAPLYQRPYVWNKRNQWEPLWLDILKVTDQLVQGKKDTKPHFLGAIVLEQRKAPTGKPDSRSIIDGQQRLTTIQLLFTAIRDICAEDSTLERHRKIAEGFILNQNVVDEEDRFKIWPTNIDRRAYQHILNSKASEQESDPNSVSKKGSRIVEAYNFFLLKITEWLAEKPIRNLDKIDALLNALQHHLKIVVIDMDSEDDAQVIFETLNARGTPLLPSDLVKNHLFHRASDEGSNVENLYKKYWLQFEEKDDFWRQEITHGRVKRPRIDLFLQHYLSLMLNKDILARDLFSEYQTFIKANKSNKSRWFFKSFRTYADYFEYFQTHISRDNREGLFLWRIHTMDITTIYPFLMRLYHEFSIQDQPLGDKLAILGDIESFLVRRMVCGLTTKNYNRLFLDLLKYLERQKDFSRKAIREYLLKQSGDSVRWPDDEEFKQAWLERSLYTGLRRPRLRLLLLALDETMGSSKTEKYTLNSDLTVEHLMPQNWDVHWPLPTNNAESAEKKFERIQRRNIALHTIGNLTFLTGALNPAISNGPFKRKKKEILKHSPINLNRFFQETNKWDEAAILKRSRKLFTVVKKVWAFPK